MLYSIEKTVILFAQGSTLQVIFLLRPKRRPGVSVFGPEKCLGVSVFGPERGSEF